MVIGIVAHVDAGKTTLSEAILYLTGQIRSLGRVDHQDAYLDTDAQERERGITIFSRQARFQFGEHEFTLVDTPGHVDFSSEMERVLQVLDYALLVISGTDGVQGHTRTLWRLLRHYEVPTFLFINKMDLAGADREMLIKSLQSGLSDACVDFAGMPDAEGGAGEETSGWYENLAVCGEDFLEEYLNSQEISPEHIRHAVAKRRVFPCFFGSALKTDGVRELLDGLARYTVIKDYPQEFAARVYKIGRDSRNVRLTYLKVTGGALHVKDRVSVVGTEEKVDQIRLCSGEKFETVDGVRAGEVCAVTGLTSTYPGQGLGAEEQTQTPVLAPVMNYRIALPVDVNPAEMMGKLRELEEEDPQLHILWKEELQEIRAQMMGQVQIEVLTRLIRERFGVSVVFEQGHIVYRETVAKSVEGIGHFEPLRHYAEVHLLIAPGEPGSGVQVESACSEDILDINWQRLIASHVEEREHPGVLTGAPLTDVKITILTGRAHNKHTEGGDFRQATYRAIRQGLKSTECVLLEPWYAFVLEVPGENVGRAMSDVKKRFGTFEPPEFVSGPQGERAILRGRAPVATMQDYMAEVHAYTKGMGNLALEVSGYDVCHNSGEVIAAAAYDSEADVANPTGSVFCAHGAGFVVPWDEVEKYMHLERAYIPGEYGPQDGRSYRTDAAVSAGEAERLSGVRRRKSWEKTVGSMSSLELDRELADVYAREFGMSREDMEEAGRKKWGGGMKQKPKAPSVKLDKKGNPIYPARGSMKQLLVVDGYNIIFSWKELKELSQINIDSARDRLKDILCNYQGFEGCRVIVVFDAYRIRDNSGRKEFYDGLARSMERAGKTPGIEVVYTRTDETADAYIERLVHLERENYRITVATDDAMEQLTIMSQGALRMSAKNLAEEIARVENLW